jgi:hypothetical protein
MVYLIRYKQTDQGTRGILFTQDYFCHTLELPWRDNKRNISCIPTGIYYTTTRISPTFGRVYHLQDVPNRTYIYIHSGNLAGDTSKGYLSHVNGCILLGKNIGTLHNQQAILNSRTAIREFTTKLNWQDFQLTIGEI